MKRLFALIPVCLLLAGPGCTTDVPKLVHCHGFVEAKIDLQGDYYSLESGKGAGYEFRFRAVRDDGQPLPQLKLVVVGMSESKRFGEAGDSVSFGLASEVPIDGVLHPDDILSYKILQAHADSPSLHR